MTIAIAAFDHRAGSGVSTFDTNTKTWISGNLYIVSVFNFLAAGAAVPTISGLTQQGSSDTDIQHLRLTVFSFLGDGATNVKTIDFGGTNQTFIEVIVDECTGTITTGTNGTDAFVQVVGNDDGNTPGTTASVTLSAFADAGNATWFGNGNGNGASQTVKAGFTGLSISNGTLILSSEYLASPDTAPNQTWTTNAFWVAFGIELAATAAPSGSVTNLHTSRRAFRRAIRRGMH